MKVLLVLVFLFSAVVPRTQQTNGVQVEYDRFKDETEVTLSLPNMINLKGAKQVALIFYFMHNGQTGGSVGTLFLMLRIVKDPGIRLDDTAELRLLVDGKISGPFIAEKDDSRATQIGLLESYTLNNEIGSTGTIIHQIAQGKKVEGQIGQIEFEFPAAEMSKLIDFDKRIPDLTAPQFNYMADSDRTIVKNYDSAAIIKGGAKSLHLGLMYTFPGKSAGGQKTPAIVIHFVPNRSIDLDNIDLEFIIDGKSIGPIPIGDIDSIGESRSTSVLKNAGSIIEKIANGKRVSGRLGPIQFELTPEIIAQTKALYNSMQKTTNPAPY